MSPSLLFLVGEFGYEDVFKVKYVKFTWIMGAHFVRVAYSPPLSVCTFGSPSYEGVLLAGCGLAMVVWMLCCGSVKGSDIPQSKF
ncbi:hypothetical protein PRUPE_7G019200 [Prunus persica]|uniref:Uncharacterized protein n=1 Tax=Prunus persica TaxID=3760 RepID=A0A251N5A2_PRUPE|nr:hypothetical protein PRUPE_7G019200 [Prunus persica]